MEIQGMDARAVENGGRGARAAAFVELKTAPSTAPRTQWAKGLATTQRSKPEVDSTLLPT